MNNQTRHDEGVITAMLERFEHQRLPHLLSLKEQMDAGKTLSEDDLHQLTKVIADSHKITPLIDRNPRYHQLVVQAVALHKEIVEKALENEIAAGGGESALKDLHRQRQK